MNYKTFRIWRLPVRFHEYPIIPREGRNNVAVNEWSISKYVLLAGIEHEVLTATAMQHWCIRRFVVKTLLQKSTFIFDHKDSNKVDQLFVFYPHAPCQNDLGLQVFVEIEAKRSIIKHYTISVQHIPSIWLISASLVVSSEIRTLGFTRNMEFPGKNGNWRHQPVQQRCKIT